MMVWLRPARRRHGIGVRALPHDTGHPVHTRRLRARLARTAPARERFAWSTPRPHRVDQRPPPPVVSLLPLGSHTHPHQVCALNKWLLYTRMVTCDAVGGKDARQTQLHKFYYFYLNFISLLRMWLVLNSYSSRCYSCCVTDWQAPVKQPRAPSPVWCTYRTRCGG